MSTTPDAAAIKKQSWIDIPPESDFSIDNIPFGVCSFPKYDGNDNTHGNDDTTCGGMLLLPPSAPRCCTAIGKYAVDLHVLANAGLLDDLKIISGAPTTAATTTTTTTAEVTHNFHPRIAFSQSSLNNFMSCEKPVWIAVRNRLISLFLQETIHHDHHSSADNNNDNNILSPDPRLQNNTSLQQKSFHPLASVLYHLPAKIGDYTDFYSSREHATNVGIMFRGKENALQPNWLHMPIGYHGRSSSVYPSVATATTSYGVDNGDGDGGKGGGDENMSFVRRPCGQLQIDPTDPKKGSTYGPSKLMDFELEVAFFVGGPTNHDDFDNDDDVNNGRKGNSHNNIGGKPLTLPQASDRIFGYVLMNDWSARDIQKWEYVPLGPFTAKNFATTISTWVVTPMALEPFRCEGSAGREQGGKKMMNARSSGNEGCDVVVGTELSDGVDVGGGGMRDDPVPLEYLRDPNYGSYDVSLTVSLQPNSSKFKPTQICQSNLKHMYWSSVQQLVHHSVTGCPMNAGDLLASGTISGKERRNFGSMLELSWKGTREIVLDGDGGGGEVRKFLKDGDAVIMEGWCDGKEGLG
eukprot:CAMPEP_0201624026 /NCGR_PEP_ID=MMETSP0493-20130528/354_1 /ASSEMBLY_ACC=CAM_ASM_000838 /TAXON_ID=420259 /ORGANISM="Thalassiosira gravida, Strain GMp14c1" /LENGTH=577 /DNA_ID=CAMNT_0048093789 /DNA_START=36 /DNA_END=1766 /DNA_ORIENTATION=-